IAMEHKSVTIYSVEGLSGYIRLRRSFDYDVQSSYWLTLRTTIFNARPQFSHIHVYISIRNENNFIPQCHHVYEEITLVEQHQTPFIQIKAVDKEKDDQLNYAIVEGDEKQLFYIDSNNGQISFQRPMHQRQDKRIYVLTIRVSDSGRPTLSSDCLLKVNVLRRKDVRPQFLHNENENTYYFELPEINRSRLKQRLFQIVAILNLPEKMQFNNNLQIRYRLLDPTKHFVINKETGYIAARQSLTSYSIYSFQIEAFTVIPSLFQNEIYSSNKKYRSISQRIQMPVKVQILPFSRSTVNQMKIIHTIPLIQELLSNKQVGDEIMNLNQFDTKKSENRTKWFILNGIMNQTKYFHVNLHTGQLFLIRSIMKLISDYQSLNITINETDDWKTVIIYQITIRIISINIENRLKFTQLNYYVSIVENIPVGVEITQMNINSTNSSSCTYGIQNVERKKSDGLFRINHYNGIVSTARLLNKQTNGGYDQHILTIVSHCHQDNLVEFYVISTRLHINILDLENDNMKNMSSILVTEKNDYQFLKQNYIVIINSTFLNEKKELVKFQLDKSNKIINFKPKINSGDPYGLFTIENHSLILLDQRRTRLYKYPLMLTIINDSINCTVTIYISNIGLQMICPVCKLT
ncbi:unnamed protein product, partial [Didymodactylos carnosus]